jgi:hypothetical protein
MLAAVAVQAPATEGLRNYLLRNTGRPSDVRAFDQGGVRQPMGLPNGAVPGAQNPIPTSSARPSKPTNARIVYTRVQTAFPKACGAIDITPVCEGDVLFVHRQDGSTSVGRDTSRTSRVATLQQLNNVLGFFSGDPSEIGEIVMPVADKYGNVLSPAGLDVDDYVAERGDVGVSDVDARKEWDDGMIDHVAYRWKHCRWLAQWTPDGILANNEHDCTMDNSNSGEVYNVAIGGPTLMRNAYVGDYPQHFDDGAGALDKVFVGLIPTLDASAKYWTFKYQLFTSRQLLWAKLAIPSTSHINAHEAGGNNSIGPTAKEFRSMVQVWRMGSIVDKQSGMLPYKCVTLNVVVEEWTKESMAKEFNIAL